MFYVSTFTIYFESDRSCVFVLRVSRSVVSSDTQLVTVAVLVAFVYVCFNRVYVHNF